MVVTLVDNRNRERLLAARCLEGETGRSYPRNHRGRTVAESGHVVQIARNELGIILIYGSQTGDITRTSLKRYVEEHARVLFIALLAEYGEIGSIGSESMRRECAGARPNTCLGNRRIGDRHGHTLIFRQIRSSDRRRGNRSHRTGLLDLAPSRFLSARHFVHTTVIYHLGKSFIKGYAHLVTLVQTERRRFYLTTVERDAVTGLRRILGSEDQVVEGIIGTGYVVHHHCVQITICIGIHRSLRISHLRDQLGNGNGRSLTRIGRNHTAFEIDLLTAAALDELYVIDCECRRQISRETDRKLADSLLEREI